MGEGGASDKTVGEQLMTPRRLAAVAALCGAVVLAGWLAAERLGFGSPHIENTEGAIEGSRTTSAAAGVEPVFIQGQQVFLAETAWGILQHHFHKFMTGRVLDAGIEEDVKAYRQILGEAYGI